MSRFIVILRSFYQIVYTCYCKAFNVCPMSIIFYRWVDRGFQYSYLYDVVKWIIGTLCNLPKIYDFIYRYKFQNWKYRKLFLNSSFALMKYSILCCWCRLHFTFSFRSVLHEYDVFDYIRNNIISYINMYGNFVDSLKSLDLVTMKALDSKVNIIPVIAKADTITKQELQKFKIKVS